MFLCPSFGTVQYIKVRCQTTEQCCIAIEPPHDKTNKMACAPNEDSDQPGHPPSLIRDFALRSVGIAKNPSFLHADSEGLSD